MSSELFSMHFFGIAFAASRSRKLEPATLLLTDERLTTIKPSTLKRQLAPLHNMFELAKDEWGLPFRENPLRKLRVSSVQGRRERRLKNGELDQLIVAARACRNPLVLPIVLLAVETGMRRGEILSLRWEHIGRETSSLLIPHSKNGHSRVLPLTRATAAILDAVPDVESRVFPLSRGANWPGTGSERAQEYLTSIFTTFEAISL
jgi:integrase